MKDNQPVTTHRMGGRGRQVSIRVPGPEEGTTHRPIRWTYTTRHVEPALVRLDGPIPDRPDVGDVLVARVLHVGRSMWLESRQGRRVALFPFDRVVGVLGHRYATDQIEGYARLRGDLADVLAVGGVFGEVVSHDHRVHAEPTLVRIEAGVVDFSGVQVNIRSCRAPLPTPVTPKRPRTILVVGTSMNAGKTTTAGGVIAGFVGAGYRVAAAKITGTSSAKDLQFMEDAGAVRVLDFTDAGWPSTFLCTEDQLIEIHDLLRQRLLDVQPDVVVLEIADGILQRETRLLLESARFRPVIDFVMLAASDSVGAYAGVRHLTDGGYRVLGVSGMLTTSSLAMGEVTAATSIGCYDMPMLCDGSLVNAVMSVTEPQV